MEKVLPHPNRQQTQISPGKKLEQFTWNARWEYTKSTLNENPNETYQNQNGFEV